MSQKSTHNSKRRPPGENTQSPQQDADWGFDPDEGDPAIEKKLAVALVVCLLAGFGFVFYQKFRLLRSDDTQQASADALAEQVEPTDTGDAHTVQDTLALAQESATLGAPESPASAAASGEVESPFYERDEAHDSVSDADEAWTLVEADAAEALPAGKAPAGLPPLPESDPTDGFDPFADGGEALTSEPDPAAEGASPAQTSPAEPPMLVWDEPAAHPVTDRSEPDSDASEPGLVQSEPTPVHSELELAPEPAASTTDVDAVPAPGALPEIAAQPSRTGRSAEPDPFAFNADDSNAPSPSERATESETGLPSVEEPPMQIFGGPQESSEASESEPVEMAIDPLPTQSEPRAFGTVDTEQPDPHSQASSDFDPFGGASVGEGTEAGSASDSAPASGSASPRSSQIDTAAADMGDPFPPADPLPPAQSEPSPADADAVAGNPQPAGDPFAFPAANSNPPGSDTPLPDAPPSAGRPTFEPLPAASAEPADGAPAPNWPQGSSSRSPQTAEGPTGFPPSDRGTPDEPGPVDGPAPLQSPATQGITIEPNLAAPRSIEPTPTFAGQSQTPTASSAPNPFALDIEPSRPALASPHDAQRVVGEREITVTPSDSFWSISEREYGNSRYFNALARYNQKRVAKPELLQSGMKILIPPPEVLEDRFPEMFQRTAQEQPTIAPMTGTSSTAPAESGLFLDELQRPCYRVGEKDTLSSIARQHLGRESRWTEIYDLNKDRLKSPSTLTIGMVLKLPRDASGVRVSPAGGFDR